MDSMIIITKKGTIFYASNDKADKTITEFYNSNKLLFSYIKIVLRNIDKKSKVQSDGND